MPLRWPECERKKIDEKETNNNDRNCTFSSRNYLRTIKKRGTYLGVNLEQFPTLQSHLDEALSWLQPVASWGR
ncbi:hypothetical protein JCM19055_2864 [Geomicrobium sp. JCM 19055]|nr:hypothetical protein JCM19055_2864 [Geomicrobium sp. JCM 19055]